MTVAWWAQCQTCSGTQSVCGGQTGTIRTVARSQGITANICIMLKVFFPCRQVNFSQCSPLGDMIGVTREWGGSGDVTSQGCYRATEVTLSHVTWWQLGISIWWEGSPCLLIETLKVKNFWKSQIIFLWHQQTLPSSMVSTGHIHTVQIDMQNEKCAI